MGANTHKRHRLFACVILNGTAGELQVELVISVKPQFPIMLTDAFILYS